ncbi:MAG: 50S ribosomal protein L14 [Nitrospiraceae bacterium]|nr:50S ribosomal protein L14 [Nitrospiraceae bacterium]
MIQVQTYLNVADNSGAKRVQCVRILGGFIRKYAMLGDKVVVSVKDSIPNATAQKGKVYKAVVVRTKKESKRHDGSYVKFDDNAVVLLNNQGEPLGTRILGPIARETRNKGYTKIASLAPEVI